MQIKRKFYMGLFKKNSHSSYENMCDELPNPDPSRYKIIKYKTIGKYLIVCLNYPDCTNYEGNKILLYKDCSIEDLKRQKYIDPHFSNSIMFHSPIARFVPNGEGWYMATNLANLLTCDFSKKMCSNKPLRIYK